MVFTQNEMAQQDRAAERRVAAEWFATKRQAEQRAADRRAALAADFELTEAQRHARAKQEAALRNEHRRAIHEARMRVCSL